MPTLIVWGEADTAFDLKSPEWLKNNIGGVRRLIMVPRAKLFFPRGASQADERAAAGILAQHRVRSRGHSLAAMANLGPAAAEEQIVAGFVDDQAMPDSLRHDDRLAGLDRDLGAAVVKLQ